MKLGFSKIKKNYHNIYYSYECNSKEENNCTSCHDGYTLFPIPVGSCRKCKEGEIFNEIYECIACNENC